MSESTLLTRRFRVRRDGTLTDIQVRQPNQKEIEAAEMSRSVTFNRSLRHGLPPQQTFLRQLAEHGAWTEADDAALEAARELASNANDKYSEASDDDTRSPEDVAILRAELEKALVPFNERNAEFRALVSHTADAKGEESHRQMILACVTEDVATGQRLWSSVDAMLEDAIGLVRRVAYEYSCMVSGVASEWPDETEEVASPDEADAVATPMTITPATPVGPPTTPTANETEDESESGAEVVAQAAVEKP